jgi:ubiquitin-protein ligase
MKKSTSRLTKELNEVLKHPVEYVAQVSPKDGKLNEMHFVLQGPKNTPYEGGMYWGVFQFPPEYPLKPPALIFYTPSGRFTPGVKVRIYIYIYIYIYFFFFFFF